MKAKLLTRFMIGEDEAAALAAALVRRGIVFRVEPYPEDEWQFQFKPEAKPTVESEIHKIETTMAPQEERIDGLA